MIIFRDADRGSGKTSYVIEQLKNNKNTMAAVPNRYIKENIYPKEVQDQVWTFEQLTSDLREMSGRSTGYSRHIKCVFIDECFMENIDLYQLYYYLGRVDQEVVCLGTSHNRFMESLGRPIRPLY